MRLYCDTVMLAIWVIIMHTSDMNTNVDANHTPIALVKSIAAATESSPWYLDSGQEAFGVFVESTDLGVYDECHFTGSWRDCRDLAVKWNAEHASGKSVRLGGGICLIAHP